MTYAELAERGIGQGNRVKRAGREFEGGRIASVLVHAAMVGSVTPGKLGRDQAQLVLEPPLPGVHLLDWKALDRAVEAGYRYALGRIDELRALGSDVGQGSTIVAGTEHGAG